MTSTSPIQSPTTLLANNPRLHLPTSTLPPGPDNPPTQKTWLVFGATGQIGRSLVRAALAHGDNVAAVGRTMENSMRQMQGWHERCLGLLCDVRVRETVKASVDKCIAHFGGVDIVVNCTGYGVIAACEDQDACDLRSQFETNFLGTLNIIQLTLPYFREQAAKLKESPTATSASPDNLSDSTPTNAGRYLIFSSTSGALGVPGLGPYCATKYATEGLIESMLYEIDTFGIKATLVEPGHVRLDEPTGLENDQAFGGVMAMDSESHKVEIKRFGHFFVKKPSAPYDTPTAPAGHARRVLQWLSDRQPTSAVKAAELIWQLGHCKYPPLRLLLGSFAIESVRDRLRSIIEEIEDWKHLHFPVAEEGGGKWRQGSRDEGREDDEDGEGGVDMVKEEEDEDDD